MMGHLKSGIMAHSVLKQIYILTVSAFSIVNAYNVNDAYRLSQHPYTWGRSRDGLENQNGPVRQFAPVPGTPPSPAAQQGNNRFSDIARRLQIGDRIGATGGRYPPQPSLTNTYNPGYQEQYNPFTGYPSQNAPGYNPIMSPSGQVFNSRPQAYPGFYQSFTDPRLNPVPRIPYWQRFNGGFEPRNPDSDYSMYPDFRRHVPPAPINPPIINPDRPYMRPAPKTDGMTDRNRDTQNNFYNQWASDLIRGPSFWEKGTDRRGQPPQTEPTTTAPPTTEAPTTVSTRPPPRVDPNFFKPDGSVNTHRLGMIKAPVDEDPIRDRDGGNTAYDIFMGVLGRNFFTESANRARGKSSEPEGAPPRPKQASHVIASSLTTTDHPPMFDKPYIDVPQDFLDADNKHKNEKNDTSDANTESQSTQGSSSNKHEDPEKYLTHDGKMFQSEVYSESLTAANTKLNSVNGVKAFENSNRRTRRQASGDDPAVSDGDITAVLNEEAVDSFSPGPRQNYCRTPSVFPRCQFYSRCFQRVNQECITRDSFIGDDVSSICGDLHALATSTESLILRTFLSEVIACVDRSLLEVLESPSCDDVTDHLSAVLLSRGARSCIAKASNFCQLLETPVARYNLARVFADPRGREDFMLRLLVSLGTHTNMCKGPGANIFLLDLLSNVMHRNTTYTMPNGQPMPVFEP